MFDDDILLPSTSSIRQSAYAHSATATQLLSAVRYHPRFQTGSSRIDGLLDGGLARGQMVEIASPPSGGKTRLAVGTAVGAVLLAMTTAKAEEVHALFIDADGSAKPSIFHSAALAACRDSVNGEALVLRICERIHLVRVSSTADLALFLHNLPSWLEDHAQVKLIVLDSISAHTKPVLLDKAERAHVFALAKTAFTRATTVHSCAVLITSQMSTKLFSSMTGEPSDFQSGDLAFMSTPGTGLGEHGSWMTRDARRVSLYFRPDGSRRAKVIAGLGKDEPDVPFGLDDAGACDVLDGSLNDDDDSPP